MKNRWECMLLQMKLGYGHLTTQYRQKRAFLIAEGSFRYTELKWSPLNQHPYNNRSKTD